MTTSDGTNRWSFIGGATKWRLYIPVSHPVSDTPVVDFSQISAVAAALQKQVARDFGPIWEVDATVGAFDKLESVPVDYWPVIVRDDINQPGAAGYHSARDSHTCWRGDSW